MAASITIDPSDRAQISAALRTAVGRVTVNGAASLLTLRQFEMLLLLDAAERPMAPVEVARRLALTRSAVARGIRRLTRIKLVQVTLMDARNDRSVVATIRSEGTEMLGRVFQRLAVAASFQPPPASEDVVHASPEPPGAEPAPVAKSARRAADTAKAARADRPRRSTRNSAAAASG